MMDSLLANGSHKYYKISTDFVRSVRAFVQYTDIYEEIVIFGATGVESTDSTEKYHCCGGNYALRLVMEKGMSEWVHIDTQSWKDTKIQMHKGKNRLLTQSTYYVPLGIDNKTFGLLKGFVIQYTKNASIVDEKYASEHDKDGFQGVMQMKLSPTDYRNPRKEEPGCMFDTKEEYKEDKYTVVCSLKDEKHNPSWMRTVKKEFPKATFFESVEIPGLIGDSDSAMEGAHMSAGGVNPGMDESGMEGAPTKTW